MSAAPVIARALKYKITLKTGEVLTFDKAVVTIGREPSNDISFEHDPKVSRHHAEIRAHMGRLLIKNVSDKNFMVVGGERLDEAVIDSRLTVYLGDQALEIEPEVAPVQSQMAAKDVAILKPAFAKSNAARISNVSHNYAPPAHHPGPVKQPRAFRKKPSSRMNFYAIVAVIGVGAFWLLSGPNGAKKTDKIRMDSDILQTMQQSDLNMKEIEKRIENKGEQTLQYKTAQEHYIRGFRDYRNGQYARAMQSFQAALSFYPSHELARKYYDLSRRKFDETVQMHMTRGRQYRGKNNWRLCQSSFASAMVMLKDPNDKKYQEARTLYNECKLMNEDKY